MYIIACRAHFCHLLGLGQVGHSPREISGSDGTLDWGPMQSGSQFTCHPNAPLTPYTPNSPYTPRSQCPLMLPIPIWPRVPILPVSPHKPLTPPNGPLHPLRPPMPLMPPIPLLVPEYLHSCQPPCTP